MTNETPSGESGEKKKEEDIIEKCIGPFGRWQIWVCCLAGIAKFPTSWHMMSIIFLAPPIKTSCVDSNVTDLCSNECPGIEYDTTIFSSTITTEWHLVCDKKYLVSVSQSVLMLGILLGSVLFGYLSDRFGRHKPMVFAIALQSMAGLVAAFSPWFFLFVIMRFLAAVATAGTLLISFVLLMEVVGTKYRMILGCLSHIPYFVGHASMVAISYSLRDWREFQIAISAPTIILLVYFWILPESPRWQLSVGKKEQAIYTLQKAAAYNKLPVENIERDVTADLQKRTVNNVEKKKGNLLDLVKTRIILTYTLLMCVCWLVSGFCYYGANQYVGQLGGDIFLNVALSALIQLPSNFFACWSATVWGRRKTLMFAYTIASMALGGMSFLPKDPSWLKPAFACLGIFGITLSFVTIYTYSIELFPTFIRNAGMGVTSMFARVGSMLAPFAATWGGGADNWLPPTIFSVACTVASLVCLKLPETLGKDLPETVEDTERLEMKKIKK
ncbi:unnamed protein product [Acanthoscelides obtectus]|uniref:Major facilitator superfamily (MFS) profile domain-containing protein n=1 Tax=Acanthoscelides obtectus TaxID=200917 RepID=A0A9P0P6R5_ACAOB|nr:unnamed protein product [Acanthoscelides obtectus]CAH1971051.1 unnamed protein product [Acanthoscelides obtectus]CAK1680027.1 Organic cation transporter protein [Acanthoscelides obtectus]CAK1680029.1 Organic cation transporter protein [Acanthoscelides obtectus]